VLQTGKYFFRIKALSKDGSEQFSNMLVQDLTTPNFVSIVPNIVKQGQPVKILLHNIAQINRLDLMSVDGKLLKQFPLRELTEWNTSEFGVGVYYLRVIRKDGRSFIEKLVVN
jgi:hypothetical protein